MNTSTNLRTSSLCIPDLRRIVAGIALAGLVGGGCDVEGMDTGDDLDQTQMRFGENPLWPPAGGKGGIELDGGGLDGFELDGGGLDGYELDGGDDDDEEPIEDCYEPWSQDVTGFAESTNAYIGNAALWSMHDAHDNWMHKRELLIEARCPDECEEGLGPVPVNLATGKNANTVPTGHCAYDNTVNAWRCPYTIKAKATVTCVGVGVIGPF